MYKYTTTTTMNIIKVFKICQQSYFIFNYDFDIQQLLKQDNRDKSIIVRHNVLQ